MEIRAWVLSLSVMFGSSSGLANSALLPQIDLDQVTPVKRDSEAEMYAEWVEEYLEDLPSSDQRSVQTEQVEEFFSLNGISMDHVRVESFVGGLLVRHPREDFFLVIDNDRNPVYFFAETYFDIPMSLHGLALKSPRSPMRERSRHEIDCDFVDRSEDHCYYSSED